MTSKYKVGIIVGYGLDDMDIMTNPMPRPVTTIFGNPSSSLIECRIQGVECAIMPRNSVSPTLPPNLINYRANIWALKEAGCTHVIDILTAGSLKEEIKPGMFIIPSNFIDFTNGRSHTFFDGQPGSPSGVLLCPMTSPVCESLRKLIVDVAAKTGVQCKNGGVGITINGPRFATKAECKMYQMIGGDFVNMAFSSDAILSKEATMLYSGIVLIANYDSWKDDTKVTMKNIKKMKSTNRENLQKLIADIVKQIGEADWDKDIENLKVLLQI
ncbi:s-methyl-5'-thioadenosine phosphorylase [Holotrichia oblita]|uniref:S-methyl-5'-thioadenosine phosphorylase n=1 Tax=Holotrichia oblita TaxID=644536 RepID=A0ACB9TLY2_HOLOL|nr:s-methyl-5'-thioadenosine phosphorylase [Holotrichia oblita]